MNSLLEVDATYRIKVVERVRERVNGPFDPEACIPWSGSITKDGYGRMTVTFERGRSRVEYAHRLSFIVHCGDIPFGMHVLHGCHRPSRVNPCHL